MLQTELRRKIVSFIPQPKPSKEKIGQASGTSQDGAKAVEDREEFAMQKKVCTDDTEIQTEDLNVLANQQPITTSQQRCQLLN